MASKLTDLVLVYSFLKRLVTPFDKTDAFKLGLIDKDGNKIKKAETTAEENAYGTFDRLVFNIKKLIERLPGGKSRLASYAAALFLIRESANTKERYTDDEIMQALEENMQYLKNNDKLTYKNLIEDAPANATGTAVAGTGDDSSTVPVKKKKREVLIDRDGRKKDMRKYIRAYLERKARREEIMKRNELRKRMGL